MKMIFFPLFSTEICDALTEALENALPVEINISPAHRLSRMRDASHDETGNESHGGLEVHPQLRLSQQREREREKVGVSNSTQSLIPRDS